MKKAELTPTAQKIDNIINRIDEGDIKIPAFSLRYPLTKQALTPQLVAAKP
ncbi:MAG: hypothetical protein KJO08_05790 [Gammaproteobacteria bacterium]|nr:hypothetical protein [Gammaproteobacteria bacterium]NNJ84832.1 hypothetical protein [Gammaproteobacteria bacterium]